MRVGCSEANPGLKVNQSRFFYIANNVYPVTPYVLCMLRLVKLNLTEMQIM